MFRLTNKSNETLSDITKLFPELQYDGSTLFCSLSVELNPNDIVRGNIECEFSSGEIEGMADFCIDGKAISELEFEDGALIRFE